MSDSAKKPQPELRDVLEIERPEQLKALGHPLRLKVLQALGSSPKPMTNRDLAVQLAVDPGHLHFHVRMLQRAGLIELAPGEGREKPYRPVARTMKVAPEIRATGLATELQAAQLRDVQRGFEQHAPSGEFRSAQVHATMNLETLRGLLNDLIERINELEDETESPYTITIAFHPSIIEGEPD